MNFLNLANLGQLQNNMNAAELPKTDTAEQIYISSLALLKMLKHARAGVPLEVMGLMLGEFVDEYTIKVVDVFAMPQKGLGEAVEAVDEVYQYQMAELLKQTQRNEVVVGWYHSHPGFGCWLSPTDIMTTFNYQKQHPRCVAVVVDPIQSVKGKVEIQAFRVIEKQLQELSGIEPRQSTSNIGHINPPSYQALFHKLNREYYQININFRKNELETDMLLNLYKDKWSKGLEFQDSQNLAESNESSIKQMSNMSVDYAKRIEEEIKEDSETLKIKNVGKFDPKRHLESNIEDLMNGNIMQILGTMVNTKIF